MNLPLVMLAGSGEAGVPNQTVLVPGLHCRPRCPIAILYELSLKFEGRSPKILGKGAKQGLMSYPSPSLRVIVAASVSFSGLEGLSKRPQDEKQGNQPLNSLPRPKHCVCPTSESPYLQRKPRCE